MCACSLKEKMEGSTAVKMGMERMVEGEDEKIVAEKVIEVISKDGGEGDGDG
jgi:hypothetical protein